MRTNVVGLGLVLIVLGILLSTTIVGLFFGIPLGIIGFIVLIVGLFLSSGVQQQQPAGYAPPNPYRPVPQQVAIPTPNQTLPAGSKYCVSCRSIIPNSYEFCNVCGQRQPAISPVAASSSQQAESKFCPACGTKMPASSAFCPNCGITQK